MASLISTEQIEAKLILIADQHLISSTLTLRKLSNEQEKIPRTDR